LIISCNIRGETDLALELALALDLAAMSSVARQRAAKKDRRRCGAGRKSSRIR
jgi:hypothetical protein